MKKPKVSILSIIIMIATILSIIFALFLVAFPPKEFATSTEGLYYGLSKIWVFYLFLPISIGSIIFGFKYIKEGYKVKKNIVIGIIFSSLLFGFGSMHFLGLMSYSTDYNYVVEIEQKINVSFPSDGTVVTMDWTGGVQTSSDSFYYKFESVVRFSDPAQISSFEGELGTSGIWVQHLSLTMQNTIPTIFLLETQGYDFFLLYSVETQEYNEITNTTTEQNFIYVAYDVPTKVLLIDEFGLAR